MPSHARRWLRAIRTRAGRDETFPRLAGQLLRRVRVHANHAHAWIYRASRGRIGGVIAGHRVLLLTTTGRRTGRPRRTPVQYERLDGHIFIVASSGGSRRPPAWWRNVEADPRVRVQIGAVETPGRAVTVGSDVRESLWRRLCERNARLPALQRKARRELPIVRFDAT